MRMCPRALSAIASAVGWPYFSSSSFSREPPLTPMRIGTLRAAQALTTSSTFQRAPMLPGLRRSPATPA